MFKVRLIFYILYFIFATSSALAQSEVQIRQQINQAASQMKSMQCDFVQTKHLKMLNDKMVARGKMYYRQGNQLRWEYVTPYAYTFILNNNKVLLKNSRRNDVTASSANAWPTRRTSRHRLPPWGRSGWPPCSRCAKT